MTFGSPWMLLGLVAVGAVLWLHLKPRRDLFIPFPAVGMLRRIALRRVPRLKVRSLLILLARILAIVALVLAVSKPGLTVRRPGGIRSGMALVQIILLDDSLSMRQTGPGGRTAFDRAREMAVAELDRLRPGDACALVLTGAPARAVRGEALFDLEHVRQDLSAAKPSYRSGDMVGALRLAAKMLEDSPLPQREVVLVTDLADDMWKDMDLPWSDRAGVGFRVIGAVSEQPPANVSVDRVKVQPLGDGVTREVEVEVVVTNHGNEAIVGKEVMLELDGQEVARGSLDVPANGSAVKRFHHRFSEEGAHRGLVRIDGDALVEDNVRYFSAVVRRALNVLVIDGDYRPGSYRDEAFYLMRALETPTPYDIPIKPMVVDVATAGTGPLGGNDVIFLAGVESIQPPLANRIIDFVRSKKGLFIAPGNRGTSVAELASIMPGRVRSVRSARRAGGAFSVDAVLRSHPIFKPFGEGLTGLEKTRVQTHLLVDPDPAVERSVVVQLKGGLPLLLERKVGKGIVMLLTTTLDRDWTDLPIRPGYLPLVQRAARYLAGRLGDREPRRVQVGRPIDLEVSEGMRRLVVLDPGDEKTVFAAKELVDRTRVRFTGTMTPGSYRVWAQMPGFGGLKELSDLEFVVGADPVESNLARVANEEESNVAGSLEGVVGVLPIWPYLLLFAVLFLLFETWLVGYGLRRSHVSK